MKTVRNKSHKALAVPLPRGKKLHLAPGQTGEVTAQAAEHPPLVAMVTADELELLEASAKHAESVHGGGRVHGSTGGHQPGKRQGSRGDR